MMFYRTSLFCRNLGVLLGSGVNLTTTLRILVDMMSTAGPSAVWTAAADRVRHGAKLSDALSDTQALPAMAVRMLRLGDETGQLPMLAGRVAEFYEAKLQRTLDRIVGIAGPAAIIVISIVVGGLIVGNPDDTAEPESQEAEIVEDELAPAPPRILWFEGTSRGEFVLQIRSTDRAGGFGSTGKS